MKRLGENGISAVPKGKLLLGEFINNLDYRHGRRLSPVIRDTAGRKGIHLIAPTIKTHDK